MRRQRNTEQMKEQGKNPPDQTNEEEIGRIFLFQRIQSNENEKEFRVKMIQNLEIEWRKYKKHLTRT